MSVKGSPIRSAWTVDVIEVIWGFRPHLPLFFLNLYRVPGIISRGRRAYFISSQSHSSGTSTIPTFILNPKTYTQSHSQHPNPNSQAKLSVHTTDSKPISHQFFVERKEKNQTPTLTEIPIKTLTPNKAKNVPRGPKYIFNVGQVFTFFGTNGVISELVSGKCCIGECVDGSLVARFNCRRRSVNTLNGFISV